MDYFMRKENYARNADTEISVTVVKDPMNYKLINEFIEY